MDDKTELEALLRQARTSTQPLPKPVFWDLPPDGWYNRRTYGNGRQYLYYRWHDRSTGRVKSRCLGRMN